MRRVFPTDDHRWLNRRPLRKTVATLSILTLVLIIDALLRAPGTFDYWLLNTIQKIDLSHLRWMLTAAGELTALPWSVIAWGLLLLLLIAPLRLWLPALAMVTIPAGAAAAYFTDALIDRTGPNASELYRAVGDAQATASPVGDVAVSTLLYGFAVVAAFRIRPRLPRLAIQTTALLIVVLSGFSRLWLGWSWVSDVLVGYTLGLMLLLLLTWVYFRIEQAAGNLPFIHAVAVPHDESTPHAHALTSTILFHDDTVTKIYAPGFLPCALYWLGFQAEFPYMRNEYALEAAVLRRNLAGKLTEYWYGSNRVAPARGIERVDGLNGLVSQRIRSVQNPDTAAARQFLFDLCDRFDEAGLPTWQVDPRQPRGSDNVLQSEDGRFFIIDLESGLVTPLASPRAWWRAFRRAEIPLFDTVFFDITRTYVEREAESMLATMGQEWLDDLLVSIDRAEAAASRWHATEPRIWNRLVSGFWSWFDRQRHLRRIRRLTTRGRFLAISWITASITHWREEGRITETESAELRSAIDAPEFHRVIPHFGVHLAIGMTTRFPVGSILRFAYSAIQFLRASVPFLLRRIDRAEWRDRIAVHSPLVIAISGMPGIGTFAYLASAPIRSNRLLMRVMLDSVLLKIPGRIYERCGWRSLLALPTRTDGSECRATRLVPGLARTSTRLAIGAAMIGGLLVIADVLLQAIVRLSVFPSERWQGLARSLDVDHSGSLLTMYTALLLCAGVAALGIAAAVRRNQRSLLLFVNGFMLFALALALDEHVLSWLNLDATVRDMLVSGQTGDWLWLVLIGLALLGAMVAGTKFASSLPLRARGLLLLGLVMFVAGEAGLEVVGHVYLLLVREDGLVYDMLTSLEELVELLGVVVMLYAVLEYVKMAIVGSKVRPGREAL